MDTLIVFSVGFLSSIIGTAAGGGGLITIPLLIFLGLSSQEAVATTIFAALGFNLAGLYVFHREGAVHYRVALGAMIAVALGTFIGAYTIAITPSATHQRMIAIAMVLIALVLTFQPDVGVAVRQRNESRYWYMGFFCFLLLGVFNALISGGAGVFATSVLTFFFGLTFIETAATRKPIFLIGNITATILYALQGLIEWNYGIVLLVGMATGSYAGAVLALKTGSKWMRIAFLLIVSMLAIILLAH